MPIPFPASLPLPLPFTSSCFYPPSYYPPPLSSFLPFSFLFPSWVSVSLLSASLFWRRPLYHTLSFILAMSFLPQAFQNPCREGPVFQGLQYADQEVSLVHMRRVPSTWGLGAWADADMHTHTQIHTHHLPCAQSGGWGLCYRFLQLILGCRD